MSNFSYYCLSSSETENTLANERRKHFTEAATETCSSNLCLAAFIKIILKIPVKESNLRKIEMNAFLVAFQRSSFQL